MNRFLTRSLSLFLLAVLCGLPNLSAATLAPQAVNSEPRQQSAQDTTTDAAPPQGTAQSDAAGNLPDSPSAAQSGNQTQPADQKGSAASQEPRGTAAAEAARTHGGAASKPAGAAIAPAKQRRTRSLLIKLGIIAGAGAALGTVYGLSKGSPSRPPGAR